jgi:hypothetical protein
MPTLQTLSTAACAVPDVPGAIVAAKHTNAHAKARELIIIFVNFVFIVVGSFCLSFLVLAVFGFSLLSCQFWPFTEYRTESGAGLCRDCRELENHG